MPPTPTSPLQRIIGTLHGVGLAALAIVILVKVFYQNDLNDTLWSDPLELWVAFGVAMLLSERSSDVFDRVLYACAYDRAIERDEPDDDNGESSRGGTAP